MRRTQQGVARTRFEGADTTILIDQSIPDGTAVTISWDDPEPVHQCPAMPDRRRYRMLTPRSWYLEYLGPKHDWRADRIVDCDKPFCEFCGAALDGDAGT